MATLSDSQRTLLLSGLGELRRFCLSLTGSAADADDLLQTTVERVLEKGMPEDAHAVKWAYRICRNAWIDEVRAREVRQRAPQLAITTVQEAPSAEEVASGERGVADVGAALAGLPEEQRLALMLVAVDGKTYAEAAEILGVPVGTIMSRIARARRTLMKRLPAGAD